MSCSLLIENFNDLKCLYLSFKQRLNLSEALKPLSVNRKPILFDSLGSVHFKNTNEYAHFEWPNLI